MHQARKRFGQHFLHDQNIIARMVSAIAPAESDKLLEIGPGQGALTFPLLAQCKQLTAVELDRDLIPILQRGAAKYGVLDIINCDILEFDLSALAGTDDQQYRIAGNLPYNISTPLMFHLMASISHISDMHFMVQKEVALRIVANVGDKNYGRLSIMMQYYCQCQYLFEVPPQSFTPPPKVDSAIIRLIPHPQPVIEVNELFSLIVKTAFGQRRKTISNSLKKMIEPSCFEAAQIDRSLRAECLTGADFARLTNTKLSQDSNE
jgi:16S rRNA (adenine1518-N6/adenine1519-N6)-dimethyltransferase